jgi:guanylate kinase
MRPGRDAESAFIDPLATSSMNAERSGRLVILSGPSCMGKTPLVRSLRRLYPQLANRLRPLVLYNSREPRPIETDGVEHHFRSREQIEQLRDNPRFVVVDVRGDLQALDVEELCQTLRQGDVLYEGNPYVARTLQTDERLRDVPRLGIFLTPISKEEILDLRHRSGVSLPDLVAQLMRGKLLRRALRQKPHPSSEDISDIDNRATRAFEELKLAHHFDHVIPNHDGEDSDHWEACPVPLGDARRVLLAVVALLEGRTSDDLEAWDVGLIPAASGR